VGSAVAGLEAAVRDEASTAVQATVAVVERAMAWAAACSEQGAALARAEAAMGGADIVAVAMGTEATAMAEAVLAVAMVAELETAVMAAVVAAVVAAVLVAGAQVMAVAAGVVAGAQVMAVAVASAAADRHPLR